MAGAAGEPIGPFPEGVDPVEYDKLRRRVLWTMPSGLYLVGCRAGERRNAMTANWATQVSFEPKLVAVSVERQALTHTLIHDGGAFSLSILDREDRAIVRKFVKPVEVGAGGSELSGFAFVERVTGAPILAQALAWVDCALRHEFEVGGHTLFVGEVVDAGFSKDESTPVLRMEDTRMNYGG
jgi:flavin reductase (DIM6/NTAB) family NADH-FMN oxidoreductase RutF